MSHGHGDGMHAGGGGYNGGNGGTIGQTTTAPATGTGAGGMHPLHSATLPIVIMFIIVMPLCWYSNCQAE